MRGNRRSGGVSRPRLERDRDRDAHHDLLGVDDNVDTDEHHDGLLHSSRGATAAVVGVAPRVPRVGKAADSRLLRHQGNGHEGFARLTATNLGAAAKTSPPCRCEAGTSAFPPGVLTAPAF
ncbi:MAG TPA: hypothetical protein VGC05_23225 [Mycobacterium sp.]